MLKQILYALVVLFFLQSNMHAQQNHKMETSEIPVEGAFPLFAANVAANIYYDMHDAEVVGIAANSFKADIKLLTGIAPVLAVNKPLSGYPVLIGTLGRSKYIDELAAKGKINKLTLLNKWETFSISVIENPLKGVKRALVIAGSDRRGTAFGVFELSRLLGVSPLNWWADVVPAQKKALYIKAGESIVGPPSVKYRGIFINDEDWGIQPWAAKKMDPDVKDMGSKTYTKIFELLLRLKANYIWPAMHPSTKAFFHYANNPVVADQYAIVLGASHCEPMLRNNVFEWAENFEEEYGQKPGEWRYDLNKNQISKYWADRVKQAKNYEAVYTVGMRGIHDGSMPGPKDKKEKVKLLGEVIADQRSMLREHLKKEITTVPQIFCPYKEVLSLYQAGLALPEDVTIVWADDNHGYIRQLPNAQEQQRSGGSGVYYHISYWGAPHDYLWLSSISPSLISYELTKAYQYKADRLWVINVGDIKPAEMETQFAMDLAWDINSWKPQDAHKYVAAWAAETFGLQFAKSIAQIKATYYRLGHEAKPEHLGLVTFTDEAADERIKAYREIFEQAKVLEKGIPPRLKDAYFELILYPVEAAYLMNQKMLYAKKSLQLSAQGEGSALVFAKQAKDAFERIKIITKKYNEQVANGKWDGMMSWQPRKLPVFNMPKVADTVAHQKSAAPQLRKSYQLKATAYSAKFAALGSSLLTLNGLGLTGAGMSQYPFTFAPVNENEFEKASSLTYSVDFAEKGNHTIEVKCLPTQGVNQQTKVRYAISVNEEPPQVVNVSPASENEIWKQNVLQGFATGKTNHQVKQRGKATVKIYLLDPGLVVNLLEVN